MLVGICKTSGPALTANDQHQLVLDADGNLKVSVAAAPGGASTAQIGAVNETAPASDTASSGLNGRLQRIAQRVTSLIALLPTSLGLGGGLKVDPAPGDYETVAAGATDQMMGPTGAIGDRLDGVLIIPVTTSPGAVSVEDGDTNIVIFEGGATSVPSLEPFFVPMGRQGIVSAAGGWEITTGSNVRAIGFGQFT